MAKVILIEQKFVGGKGSQGILARALGRRHSSDDLSEMDSPPIDRGPSAVVVLPSVPKDVTLWIKIKSLRKRSQHKSIQRLWLPVTRLCESLCPTFQPFPPTKTLSRKTQNQALVVENLCQTVVKALSIAQRNGNSECVQAF